MPNVNQTPSRTRARTTEKQLEVIREKLEAGATLRDTADAANVSVQTAQYWKHQFGIRGPRDRTRPVVKAPVASAPINTLDLQRVENTLLAQYDAEIARLQDAVLNAQQRLADVSQKRDKLAKALGRQTRAA